MTAPVFFSVIEHLPSELRDRFFEIREMDLSVQSKNFWKFYVRFVILRILRIDPNIENASLANVWFYF